MMYAPQPGMMYAQQPGVMMQPGMMAAQPMIMMQQPQFMMMPVNVPAGCPPGLEYLSAIDYVFVKQHTDLLEVVTDIEVANKYKVMNAAGQLVYCA